MFRKLSIIIILFFSFYIENYATALSLAGCEWPPYTSNKILNKGFFSEVIKEVFKDAGYISKTNLFPWKRAMKRVINGESDILLTLYWTEERSKDMIYSDVITEAPIGFFRRKGENIVFNKLEDLKKYTIGIVNGYSNGEEFDKATYLKTEGVHKDLLNFKKLMYNRIDLCLGDKFVGLYTITKDYPSAEDQIVFIEPPLSIKKIYIGISKKTKNYKKIIHDFNLALKKAKESGKFDDILEKHGF